MNCPVDNEVLQMTERQGVEVDYCPRCRGVWLDRGELDKILERAADELDDGDDRPPRVRADYPEDRRPFDDDRDRYRERDLDREGPYRGKRKKRSFLSEMFEFGGDD